MEINLEEYDLVPVVSVVVNRPEHVYDIEIDSEDHAFIAKSTDGAIGISHNSALISLSDLSDERLRHAKAGAWWEANVQRALSNNSAVYEEKPEVGQFMAEWLSIYESKSGERGIFSRAAARSVVKKIGRRDPDHDWGCNPCCLTGDTVIETMEYGKITIKDLVSKFQEGKRIRVLAYNLYLRMEEFAEVQGALLTRPNAEILILEISQPFGNSIKIRLTPDHPVYTQNRGYVRADEITGEDNLRMEGGRTAKVWRRYKSNNEDTYDIQTETHNFYANGILVHNSEIILRPYQFCNLTEVIVRPDDTEEDLAKKVRLATIMGTFQSTLTNFPYLRKIWQKNTEEERLLGVSFTGIYDNHLLNNHKDPLLPIRLDNMKEVAIKTNKKMADTLGIPQAAAISCTKPSGCFDKKQKIRTNRGILSFEEIFSLNGIDLSQKEDEYREWYAANTDISVFDENNNEQPITKLFINGIEDTIKLTFDNGDVIECTPNHKFKLITGEWKSANDLTEEDNILVW